MILQVTRSVFTFFPGWSSYNYMLHPLQRWSCASAGVRHERIHFTRSIHFFCHNNNSVGVDTFERNPPHLDDPTLKKGGGSSKKDNFGPKPLKMSPKNLERGGFYLRVDRGQFQSIFRRFLENIGSFLRQWISIFGKLSPENPKRKARKSGRGRSRR